MPFTRVPDAVSRTHATLPACCICTRSHLHACVVMLQYSFFQRCADVPVAGEGRHSEGPRHSRDPSWPVLPVLRRRQRKRSHISSASASAVVAAPLVLFLPEEAVEQLRHREARLDTWGYEYVLRTPNALEPLLEAALRCAGIYH